MPEAVLNTARKSWRLRGLGTDAVVVSRRDLRPGEDWVRHPPAIAPLVRTWLADPVARHWVAELFECAYGYAPPQGPAAMPVLQERLDAAFRSGRLVVLRRAAPRLTGGGGEERRALAAPPPPPPPRKEIVKEKTWVEFQLVDDAGDPVPGQKYRLKLPDGSIREGELDGNGSVRVTNIDPGSCEITFTGIDAGEWKAA